MNNRCYVCGEKAERSYDGTYYCEECFPELYKDWDKLSEVEQLGVAEMVLNTIRKVHMETK